MMLEFFKYDPTSPAEVPYFKGGVMAGFPSPAADFEDLNISFDKLVFGNSRSTIFWARVRGSSMKNAGILYGSIIFVDKNLEPRDGVIAACVINSDTSQQLSFFEYENPKHKVLMPILDKLNTKLGDKIKFAGQVCNVSG